MIPLIREVGVDHNSSAQPQQLQLAQELRALRTVLEVIASPLSARSAPAQQLARPDLAGSSVQNFSPPVVPLQAAAAVADNAHF